MASVQAEIERNPQLLASGGVEHRLQPNIRGTLEKLGHAGIDMWNLTGDKIITKKCIAVSFARSLRVLH